MTTLPSGTKLPTAESLGPPSPAGRRLELGLRLLLLLVCGLVLSRNAADPDLWGHVQYGRDLLQEGLPRTATYTYTAPAHRWINHENLSELGLAVGLEWVGAAGLLALKCLLGAGVCWLLLRRCERSEGRPLVTWLVVLAVALNLMFFWSLRPQLASFVLFAAMIPLLDVWAERPERGRWALVCLIPLLAVWANSHGGFVAGLAVAGLYVGGRLLQACWRGTLAPRQAAWPLAILSLAGLGTLINPYGWELHRWLLGSLGAPRPEILEWRAPELSLVWAPWWALVGLFVFAAVGSRLPRDPVRFAILALTLWQSVAHLRHIPFFALLFGYWMAPHLQSAWSRWLPSPAAEGPGRRGEDGRRRGDGPGHRVGVLAGELGVWLACGLVAWQVVLQVQRLPVRREMYPVAAFQYIADQQLHGKLVLRFMWAQYAIAAFGSSDAGASLVAFDGRFRTCYPQSVVDMYFDFAVGVDGPEPRHRAAESPPPDPTRILRLGEPDLLLIDRRMPNMTRAVAADREAWVLLYQDSLCQLWGRQDRYGLPGRPDYIPPGRRQIGETVQEGIADWPALPQRPPRNPPPTVQLARGEFDQ